MFNLKRVKKLNNNYVCIKKCIRGEYSDDGTSVIDGIIIPSFVSSITNYVEIIDIGDDCEIFKREHCRQNGIHGVTTICHNRPHQISMLKDGELNEECFIVTEEDLFPFKIEYDEVIPLADYIVASTEYETYDEILISDMAKQKTRKAKVIAIGSEINEIKVDDKVLLPYNTIDFNNGEKFFSCCKETEVLAIIV